MLIWHLPRNENPSVLQITTHNFILSNYDSACPWRICLIRPFPKPSGRV